MWLVKRFRSALIAGAALATTLIGVTRAILPVTGWSAAEPPVLMAKSPYGVDETLQRLKAAAEGNNFRIIREQTVDYGLVDEQAEDPQLQDPLLL